MLEYGSWTKKSSLVAVVAGCRNCGKNKKEFYLQAITHRFSQDFW